MKYSRVLTFKKFTNLMSYAEAEAKRCNTSINRLPHLKAYYEQDRDIILNVYFRWDEEGKHHCRIQCPINPLPVKGEFEVPSLDVLCRFLESNGWRMANCLIIPKDIREEGGN